MPRKTPNCAFCGKPLRIGPSVRRHFPTVAGKPEVGWHAFTSPDCAAADESYKILGTADAISLIRHLQAIDARGLGRLVANKEWAQMNQRRAEHLQ